jgi:trimeric autotransporter adhesin
MKLSRSIQLVAQATSQLAVLAAILSVTTVALMAQSTQGGVRGTVTDQTGAAVANAKVSLINDGTNETRSLVTNSEGGYDFNLVVPATYTITAEAPSFKKFSRKNVIVATQEYLQVDMKLEVGSVTESVLVTEEVPLVETANASQGQVLDNQKLVDLPNLGRNPFMMSKLSQNVMNVGPPAYNRMEDQSGSSMISIAGGPVRGNNYLLDGIPITDANNRAIIIPTIEAVQEVKIQSNTYDAEMARTGGGMFNTLMKSGTNDFHGSAYGGIRRTAWDANSFFSNAAGIPITDQPNTTWGASFGGPVWIPKVYNGKNRTFFFLAVEHYDDTQSSSQDFPEPTLLERQGNFSQTVFPTGTSFINPATGAPYPNNIIPASQLNPVGLNIANYFPVPTSAPAYYGASDLTQASTIKARAVQYTAKVDEDFFSWWRSSFSYLQYYSLEPGNTWFNSPSTTDGWRLERRVNATQLNNFFTIDPTTVLAVRYGFNRFPNYDYNSSQGYNIGLLGFAPSFVSAINPALAEFPAINMTSFHNLGDTGDNDYYSEASNNFSLSVDKYIGKHSLKVGFDYRKLKTSGAGVNNATGGFTFNTATPGTNSYTGLDLGDLLLGAPYNRTTDNATTLTDYVNYYGAYIQDNYRLSSKITVNYGMRWEKETGISEINNGLLVNFNQSVPNVLASQVTGILPLGAVEYAGLGGNPTQTGDFNTNKWGPRGGIAWQVDSKTVVRGGYGLFWAPQFALGGPISTLGYAATTSFVGSTNAAGALAPTLYNPFPNGIIQPTGNTLGTAGGIGQTISSLADPYAKSPRVQQYSIDVQRQLPYGIAFEVAYVGSYSTHMILGAPTININALNPGLLSQGTAYLNQSVPNPYFGVINVGNLAQATVPRYYLELPFSAYGPINEIFTDYNHAEYNSMVIKAQKRLSQGLTFLSTMTWSKNRDESSAGAGNSLNAGNQGAPQNPYDPGAEYSLSNVNSPFRWAFAVSYTLPFGSGQRFLNDSKWKDYVFGGWTYNAVAVYQTGFPLQIYQSDLNGQYGYGAQYPNATGVSPAENGSVEGKLYNYINPAAFTLAAQGTFGDLSRTITYRGPGQKNWDMSLFKTILIKERFQAQYRFEMLNALNSPLFAQPDTNLSSSTFGQIQGQNNFARQLQMALRFSF